jgi:glycosyltransferase involved in cell wall biosynthesis
VAPRVLIVVGADAGRPNDSTAPRRDYDALAEAMGARIIDRTAIDGSRSARLIRRIAGLGPAQAWLAFRRRGEADVILTDGEHAGIPLALLLRASRSRTKHVTIGHRLSSRKKRLFFRALRIQTRLDRIALHSRLQYDVATRDLGIDRDRLALVPYQVDVDFWSPRQSPAEEERLVVSAGLEHRDYATLVAAAAGVDATFVIGAASHWSRHAFAATALPAKIRVESFDYVALRELYARAALVVVPLNDVDNQAGVTTILEAMAMGKAVVVSQSRGQTDVVEDRRGLERGDPRPRPVSLARLLASEQGVSLEANGFYVPPGDPGALGRAITYLLDHPEERRRLGEAGRRSVEQLFTVDQFAARMHDLVGAAAHGRHASTIPALRYRQNDA